MAETKQTAEIANIVSADIFKHFGWERAGTSDHNFKGLDIPEDKDEDIVEAGAPAADIELEGSSPQFNGIAKLRDYPADVVFYYEDPYFQLRNYIHFDLKSYGASSLKGTKVVKALRSLSRVIGIAESSEDWNRKFAPQQSNYKIHGGLFVYNHDNAERGRFAEFYSKLNAQSAKVPEGKCIFIFGPERITYLLSVVNDMKSLRGEGSLPIPNQSGITQFYYPYGAKIKPQNNLLDYATAEMLLGPILVVRYRFNDTHRAAGYVVYYDGPGAEVEEFLYIFELLMKRRLLTDMDKLHLRLMLPADNAFSVFKTAIDEFAKAYHDLPAFRKQVEKIEFARGYKVQLEFSTIELGME